MVDLIEEPVAALRSAQEAFALARVMAQGAALSYERGGVAARRRGDEALAIVLQDLADAERARGDELAAAGRESEPPEPDAPAPLTPDEVEAFERSSLLTAYKIWTVAARASDRAFAFWSYQSAHARDEAARVAAEDMARAALQDAASRRRARRAAFRAQGAKRVARAPAQDLERALAERLRASPALLRAGSAETLATLSVGLAELVGPTKVGVEASAESAIPALAEALVDGYLTAAAATRDESAQERMQEAARRAVQRLAALREAGVEDAPSQVGG